MSYLFDYLFSTATFVPHGYCLVWRPDLVAMHASADVVIAIAYLSIPLAIYIFMKRRPDVQYAGVAALFVCFIALCGATHLIGAASLWVPYYGLEGLVKVLTAAVSSLTAIALWPMLPKLVAIPSPTALRQANDDLQQEIARRVQADAALRAANLDLERRVDERTRELSHANQELAASRQALREKTELLRMTFDSIEQGICVFDAELRLVDWNEHYAVCSGLPEDMIEVGIEASTIYLYQAEQGMLGDGEPQALADRRLDELRGASEADAKTILLPSNRIVEVQRYGMPGGGRVAIYKDVTERSRIEQALQASQERFEHAVSGTNDGIWDWDIDTGNVYFSPVWFKILGFDPGALPAELASWKDRIHPDDRSLVFEHLQAHLDGRTDVFRTEHRLRHRSGDYIWVEAKGKAWSVSDGASPRLAGTITDISAEKRAQSERERYEEELERSNSELNQFASVASHDLQEPLRMVTGYCELLERRYHDRLDGDARQFIGYAVEGAERMQVLIRDLLTYSRVGSDGRPLECACVRTALEVALHNLKPAIDESGAEVAAGDLPTVLGDSNQLVQLFQNLIGNAVKYRCEQRKPIVHVAVERREDSWAFSIADNGIGIDPRFAEHIFQIFKRLHTRDRYPGTGIGLAICKRIVERHGGEIWLDADRPQGVCFWFTLKAIG